MNQLTAMTRRYLSGLAPALGALLRARDHLSLKNVRRRYLPYFLALPLSLTFTNLQEVAFHSDARWLGLDATTLILCSYCLGAGLLFAFSTLGNIGSVSRVSAAIALAGFIPWLVWGRSPAGLACALLFMFGMGGCVSCSAFAYTFVLNNTERFAGAALLSFFYALAKMSAGLPLLPHALHLVLLSLLAVGTALCLLPFRARDFLVIRPEAARRKRRPALGLLLYFFIASFCLDYFYYYLPGAGAPRAMVVCGWFGLGAVLLSVLMQLIAKRSVWHMYNLFFLSMIACYALYFAPEGSFLRQAAHALHGFQLIGYTVAFYSLGCVFKRLGDFRVFKISLVTVVLGSVLTFIIPDTLSKHAPEYLLPAAVLASGALFVVFILLSPAYARHLFAAAWADDFRQADMGGAAEHPAGKAELFAALGLSPREQEVLTRLLRGQAAKQIAGGLGISVNTANFHIKNVYKKTGVSSRSELFARFGPAGPATERPPEEE